MRVCQIDARVWLGETSRREGRPVTLGSLPSSEIDLLLDRGFNWLWLRGIWEQDSSVRAEACRSASGIEAMQEALAGLELEDIAGSPIEGIRHHVRGDWGGEESFELLREDLARRGLRILLDFSPAGSLPGDLERVAALADGVALVDDIEIGPQGANEQRIAAFQSAMDRVRSIHPRLVVLSEAHLSPLTRLTADFALDDILLEALEARDAGQVRERLRAGARLVRYLERHGGRRSRSVFEGPEHLAASVISYLSPGVALFQDGQIEGRRLRQDPRLVRRGEEPPDEEVEAFHESLLEILSRMEELPGPFSVCRVRESWAEDSSHEQLVVTLQKGSAGEWLLVAVNFGPMDGQGFVDLSALEPGGRQWVLQDISSLAVYSRDGDDIAARGLYLALAPWDYNVFEVRSSQESV